MMQASLILTAALRNIARNIKPNAIVALLVAVITFIFFLGNSVMGRANASTREAFIESLTGDVVVKRDGDITMNLFGANAPIIGENFVIPVLPAFEVVLEHVAAAEGVLGITSQVSGLALLDMLDTREGVLLSGVDAASYFSLFPGIILEEGRFLGEGEAGAMITRERAARIQAQSGQFPALGTPMLLTTGGAQGFRIREVPLVGIFSYQNPGLFMNEIVIIDPQTVRALNAIQVAGTADVEITEDAAALLGAGLDDIFGGGFDGFFSGGLFDEDGGGDQDWLFDFAQPHGGDAFSPDYLQAFLDETPAPAGDLVGGDWNFIILRLEDGVRPGRFISALNRTLEPYGVVAVNWRIAAGLSAILMLLVQALFNAGLFLVMVAGVITAINILLVSVFRRTREIGTLRAIGASDWYIRSMVFAENLIISLFAGLAGIAAAALFMEWVNSLNLAIGNSLVASLLGGYVLNLQFAPQMAVLSFALAIVLGLASSIYPVESAVRIEPIKALRRG